MSNMVKFEEFPGDGDKSDRKKKVGGYILGKTLGEGSFAKVRLGVHVATNQKVAIKVIDKRLISKRDYVRKNLRREAVMLQRLCHPNIIELLEVMETENSFYIVTELADGGDFMKYLTDRFCLDEKETQKYMRQIISACDHMHRSGVIHRDLKIENLLLDAHNNMKIIDFGLSNHFDGESLLQTQCGSPAYAAPEIFGKIPYGESVDIWSIGINMYAMLTGKLPFLVDPPNNLAKLHSLILQGCQPPNYLSSSCQDLLLQLLEPSEKKRIRMEDLLHHPWINQGQMPLDPWGIKRKPHPDGINTLVVWYMVNHLSISEPSIIDAVINYKPNSVRGTYALLCQRLCHGDGLPENVVVPRTIVTPVNGYNHVTQPNGNLLELRPDSDGDLEDPTVQDYVVHDSVHDINFPEQRATHNHLKNYENFRADKSSLPKQHVFASRGKDPASKYPPKVIRLEKNQSHKVSLPELKPAENKTVQNDNVSKVREFIRGAFKSKPKSRQLREITKTKQKTQSLPENLDTITSTRNNLAQAFDRHRLFSRDNTKDTLASQTSSKHDNTQNKIFTKDSADLQKEEHNQPKPFLSRFSNTLDSTVSPASKPPSAQGRKYGYVRPADTPKSKHMAERERFNLFENRATMGDRSNTMPNMVSSAHSKRVSSRNTYNGQKDYEYNSYGQTPLKSSRNNSKKYPSDKNLSLQNRYTPRNELKISACSNQLCKDLLRPHKYLFLTTPR